jgi:hypothetical protein
MIPCWIYINVSWYHGESRPTTTHTNFDYGILKAIINIFSMRNSYLGILYGMSRSEPMVSLH